MRQVREVVAERERREGVDRLDDEDATVAELRPRELEQSDERRGRKVLDDLTGEDAAERRVQNAVEVLEEVGLMDVEAFAASERDHVRVRIDAGRLDAGGMEQREQLASSAADVEHGCRVAKVVDVRLLPPAHVAGRAAYATLEREVVAKCFLRGLRGDSARAGRRSGIAPLDPRQPLVDLDEESFALPSRGELGLRARQPAEERIDLLEDLVDELQRDAVERALARGERLDVPAHEPTQNLLDRLAHGTDDAAPLFEGSIRGDRPLGLGDASQPLAHEPAVDLLRHVEPGSVAELLAELGEECRDVDAFLVRKPCRRPYFGPVLPHPSILGSALRKINRVKFRIPLGAGTQARVFVAVLFGAPIVSLSAASGGFFPPAWGWATVGFALAAGAVLALADDIELGRTDLIMVGALSSFAVWIAVSLLWTESQTRTVLEFQRALLYVVALAALLLAARRAYWPAALGGVASAVTLLTLYGLATRLFPDVFGYDREGPYQLSRPIGYWNALGVLAAMGVVLAVGWSAHARERIVRSGVAAAIPALVVTLYFTFSRGAWVGLVIGFGVLFVFDQRRARAAASLLAVLPFTAAAVGLASQSDGLTRTNAALSVAARDGHRLALALVVLCAGASVAVSAVERVGSNVFRRARLRPAAGRAAIVVGIVSAVVLVAWGGGPRALADQAYDAFVGPPVLGKADLNARLLSASGNSRADYWNVALKTAEAKPLLGSGAGTFELRWYRDRPGQGSVRDAHNLYLEVLSELGPIGLLLLVTALAAPLAALRLVRDPLAAAGGGAYAVYLAHAGLDWDWELPAVTFTALGCGAAVIASGRTKTIPLARRPRAAALAAFGVIGLVGLWGYLGARALESSASAFDVGAFREARDAGDDAVRLAPWSGYALLARGEAQLALHERADARRTFRDAVAKEPNDWFAWYELALASNGRQRMEAVARAKELNPLGPEVAALDH